MKLLADRMEGQNSISRHGPGGVIVNGVQHQSSVIISWHEGARAWAVTTFEALTAENFAHLALAQPEVVIFGSGSRLRFVHPALLVSLTQQRIGFETMDTAAACRTYNVLLTESRRVLAALLFEPD